jgi:formate/nitrite transporter
MDYVQPADVVRTMVSAGITKSQLSIKDLLIRGFLSGAILGFATNLAVLALSQTGIGAVGAVLFPVGFIMIVLLGLELVTGSFSLLPLGYSEGRISMGTMLSNFAWVFLGNLLGCLAYAGLLFIALTMAGHAADTTGVAERFVKIASAKTLAYQKAGAAGMIAVFVKAILCNWMVCMGVVMAMTSTSTIGKIVGAWMPIMMFFALGFEHSVVNMFVIPIGMMFGAPVSFSQWWFWNEIPVTLGNFVGGLVFTGMALYLTYGGAKRSVASEAREPVAVGSPA